MQTAIQTLAQEHQYSEEDLQQFQQAVLLAEQALSEKKRLVGDTFFDHNCRVGQILIQNNSAPEVVIAGILHSLENTEHAKHIKKFFGETIFSFIREVGKINEIKSKNPQLDSEALRKIILTTLGDIRVMLVKLANKLDNMRSVHIFPPEEQKRLSEEVLSIYAPLAYRLGLERIRVQLEDVAFQNLNPKKHQQIQNFLEESREKRERNVEGALSLIKDIVNDQIQITKLKGRPKHIYSIYKKMQKKGLSFSQQYDLIGLRAIVPTERDCYALLGILHENFEPLSGRLKDYIANPKPNFYRSLHTGIKLPDGKIAEVQIRTPEMDEFAEEGLAAHWKYKGSKSEEKFEKKIAWLRGVLDMQKNIENKEFLETLKVDLFGDKIYCYTPKGDVKELPRSSTVLDFAFSVHEEVGSQTVGARVNGRFVPIKHKLVSGDVVEVVTNKNQRPRRSWIKIVTSAKSRQKIRKSLKQYESLPGIYFRSFKPEVTEEQGTLVLSEEFPKASCILAKCCLAIPGDEIVGILTKKKIISVHWNGCRQALKESNRWLPVQWRNTFNQKIKFYVEADERSGLLADLLHTIANTGFEVKEAKAKLIGNNYAQCSFNVIPRDLEHLQNLIGRVRKVNGVKKLFFE